MDKKISDFRNRVTKYIDERRLREAIAEIKNTAHSYMAWEVEDKVKLAEQNYQLMLQYLTKGAADPDRDFVYSGLVCDIYTLLDSLVSFIESRDNPSLYFSTMRYNNLNLRGSSLVSLFEKLKALNDKLSLFALVTDTSNVAERMENKTKAETLQTEIFRRLWSTPMLSHDEYNAVSDAFTDSATTPSLKQHLLSALLLGMLEQYDGRKLELMMNVYLSDTDMKVTSVALVGILLSLWKYSTRPLSRRLSAQLNAIKDTPHWRSDLQIAFIEMIRARDTERINRKMRDEVIPSMEKLRPDMINKINDGSIDPEDAASMMENPEWQDLLDKSGVSNQLKELTEMQMEGGDVMMTTFSHLKQFPFFNEIANWFLPFDPTHSTVAATMQQLDVLGDMMSEATFFCDSDKYSFMYAITAMPQQQRSMMVSQLGAQRDAIYQSMGMKDSDATQPESRRRAVNSYMQNIYRFFKLFSRKNEFFDPFETGINLISIKALAGDFDDTDMLRVVAEFYFKLGYYSDALDVFLHLEKLLPGDAARYQKIGFCEEHTGNPEKALEYYNIAELLDAKSAWTLRRMASCAMSLGKRKEALEYYRQLAEMQPDNIKYATLFGQALAENGLYDEAVKQFYKVEFLDENSTKIWRPLAWTLFLISDFKGARKYYDKIILDNPTSTDYLNLGHVALASGNFREAVNNYVLSIQKAHGDKEWFINALKADSKDLERAGIDTSTLPLIVDATLYTLNR